jgi:curli biogenesis system outer membrane secretion channel CsgG
MRYFKNTLITLAAFAAFNVAAQDGPPPVEKCTKNLGSMAVVEAQASSLTSLNQYGLRSPLPLLRIYIQQSGCFTVVERGVAMQNLQQERALASQGQLRDGSNVGGAQMVAADFVMTPNVIFAADTGGGGGSTGGFGRLGGGLFGNVLGAVAGGLKFKEANTSLIVADVRSGVQVAAAEGNARKTDFSFGAVGWGWSGWAGVGGYTSTPEGKLVASSLLDNYNNVVKEIRDKPSLINQTGGAGAQANAQAYGAPAVALKSGDTYRARLDNVKVLAKPEDGSAMLATLKKGEEIIISGKESGDYLNADGSSFSNGWVLKRLVMGGAGGTTSGNSGGIGGNLAVPATGLDAGCAVLNEISRTGPFCNSGVKITVMSTKVLDTGTAKSVDCKPVLKVENNSGKIYNNIIVYFQPIRSNGGPGFEGAVYTEKLAMRSGQSVEVETTRSYPDRAGKCNNIDYQFTNAYIY